jgi:hypothetical protein
MELILKKALRKNEIFNIEKLGYGFAFLVNQYKVSTPSKDYYIY